MNGDSVKNTTEDINAVQFVERDFVCDKICYQITFLLSYSEVIIATFHMSKVKNNNNNIYYVTNNCRKETLTNIRVYGHLQIQSLIVPMDLIYNRILIFPSLVSLSYNGKPTS